MGAPKLFKRGRLALMNHLKIPVTVHLKLAGIALWPIGKEIVAADAVPFGGSTAER